MVKTSYGILGKDIGVSDKTCGLKKIESKIVIDYVNKGIIIIPEFQRELQQDKIEDITNEFIQRHKNDENFLIKHGYTISFCKIGKQKELYLIDGQHRLETIKILCDKGYNPEIIIRIQICENIEQMKKDFKLLNINSNMPFIYTYFEDNFLQNTLLELKNLLKTNYGGCFNKNKSSKGNTNTHRLHLDSFIELIDLEKIKQLSEKENINAEYLYQKLNELNIEIKTIFDNFQNNERRYYINSKDDKIIQDSNFYLSLDNINWKDKLFKGEEDIIFSPINYKKSKIPMSIKKKIFDMDIGEREFIGKCFVCSCEISRDNAQVGHIIPEYLGGETKIENLKAICKSCNCSMGTMNLLDYKNQYI